MRMPSRFMAQVVETASATSPAQVILGLLMPVFVSGEMLLIPSGLVQTFVVTSTNALFGILIVIYRRPSTQGGTVTPAARIEQGSNIVQPSVKTD